MSDNSYWSGGGRHRPAGAAYSDDDDVHNEAERGHESPGYGAGNHGAGNHGAGYGEAGFGEAGYAGQESGYGGQYGAGQYGAGRYGRQDGGSGDGAGAYGPGGHGGRQGYGEAGSGDSPYDNGYGGYGQPDQYGTDYGAGRGYGSGPEYGTDQGYGTRSGYGQDYQSGHEYGSDYGNGTGYGSESDYGHGQDYGPGYGSGYDQNGGYPGFGAGQADYGDRGGGTGNTSGAYGDRGYADNGYADNGYADHGHGDNGYGDNGYAGEGYAGQNYSWPGDYGASGSQRRALGPGSANEDSDSLSAPNDRADTGGSGAGGAAPWAFRPDTGPTGEDYDPRDRRSANPLDRDDSGTFRGPTSRLPAGDDGFEQSGALGSSLEDTGSIRWSAGPPSARPRAERHLEDSLPGPAAAEPDGFADWHNDPSDDWHDDGDIGLLSRRFGGSGGGEPPGYGPPPRKSKGKKRRTARGKVAFWLAIFVVVLIGGVGISVGVNKISTFIGNRYGDYSGNGYGTVIITVPPGAALSQLGPELLQKGVIKALRPYDSAAAAAQNASSLQPGVYKLHHHMNAVLAVKLLLSPAARTEDKFQVADGERASSIATALAKATGISAKTFMNLINHPSQLGLPSWAPAGITAEGFLYPDVYSFQPHESALNILKQMVSDFNSRTKNLAAAAQKVNTTPWHALIAASMIQAEAGNVPDMAKISRVLWNRYKINQPLQFDSTVFYAMGKYGTQITQAQEHYRSPYNTYLNSGLPPGPIGSPNIHALYASVHPATGNWLYFITDTRKKPYKTYFTNSLSKLQQWQQEFQG